MMPRKGKAETSPDDGNPCTGRENRSAQYGRTIVHRSETHCSHRFTTGMNELSADTRELSRHWQ